MKDRMKTNTPNRKYDLSIRVKDGGWKLQHDADGVSRGYYFAPLLDNGRMIGIAKLFAWTDPFVYLGSSIENQGELIHIIGQFLMETTPRPKKLETVLFPA